MVEDRSAHQKAAGGIDKDHLAAKYEHDRIWGNAANRDRCPVHCSSVACTEESLRNSMDADGKHADGICGDAWSP